MYWLELPYEMIAYICLWAIAVSYYELMRLGTHSQHIFACNTYPTGCHNVVRLIASTILIVHLPAIKCNVICIKIRIKFVIKFVL